MVLVKEEMARYSLGFDAKNSFIYCSSCFVVVNNFRRHLREVHKQNLSSQIYKVLTEYFLKHSQTTSIYKVNRLSEDIEPLPYLETFEGFKCFGCYYCCVKESSMKQHQCEVSKIIVAKTVQSLNPKNHKPSLNTIQIL